MANPRHLTNHLLKIGDLSSEEARQLGPKLAGVQGVAEVQVVAEDGIAYLKVDNEPWTVTPWMNFPPPGRKL